MHRFAVELFQALHRGRRIHNELGSLVLLNRCTLLRVAKNARHTEGRVRTRIRFAVGRRDPITFEWVFCCRGRWLRIKLDIPLRIASLIAGLFASHIAHVYGPRLIVCPEQPEIAFILEVTSRILNQTEAFISAEGRNQGLSLFTASCMQFGQSSLSLATKHTRRGLCGDILRTLCNI